MTKTYKNHNIKTSFKTLENLVNILDLIAEPIFIKDENRRIVLRNKAHEKLTGFSNTQMLGRCDEELYNPSDAAVYIKNDLEVLATGIESISQEPFTKADGEVLTIVTKKNLYIDSKGDKYLVCITEDITKLISTVKLLEDSLKEVERLSITDHLTQIYNRLGLSKLSPCLFELANREKHQLGLIYANLNKLKTINDTLGHEVGDCAIYDIAQVFKSISRTSDILARIGGDEFVILGLDITPKIYKMICERVNQQLDELNQGEGRRYHLSVSLGIAYFDPQQRQSIDELLAVADADMYRHKAKPL